MYENIIFGMMIKIPEGIIAILIKIDQTLGIHRWLVFKSEKLTQNLGNPRKSPQS